MTSMGGGQASCRQRIAELMSGVLRCQVSAEAGARRSEQIAWDSLNHLRIVLAIEEEFGLRFAAEQVAGFASMEDLVMAVDASS